MRKSPAIKIALGALLIFIALFAVYVNRAAEKELKPWSGYGYSSENNGLDPRLVDTFIDAEQCKQAAAAFFAAHISLGSPALLADCKKGCVADRFVCCKSAVLPDLGPGSASINDYQCAEKITLPVAAL